MRDSSPPTSPCSTPADTEDFARIHRQYLTRLPGVAQMQTSFALRTVVKTTALAV